MFLSKLRLMGACAVIMVLFALGVLQFVPALGSASQGSGVQATVVPGQADTLQLPPEAPILRELKIGTIKARGEPRSETLKLMGTLRPNPDRLFRIHSRFSGEIVEIGQVQDKEQRRPLRFGDKVRKGDLLAVVWNKDLGEKKAAVVDALVQLAHDRKRLEQLTDLWQKGVIAQAALREAQAQVQKDATAVTAAERTLRLWRIGEDDINALRQMADDLALGKRKPGGKQEGQWARVEIRAPTSGTLLEKNVSLGDIVETTTTLFQTGDLSQLQVVVDAPERMLPALQALPEGKRRWLIRGLANLLIDPKVEPQTAAFQIHVVQSTLGSRLATALPGSSPATALLTSTLDNRKGSFLVGQFVNVSIQLSEQRQELAIPTSALVEEGGSNFVLVQTDAAKAQYTLRRVLVVRRDRDVVHILALPSAAGEPAVRPGDRVVTAGAAELKALLEDLKAER
jgi:cobalt-zinc-cadmium efflux system membrane fusion protein